VSSDQLLHYDRAGLRLLGSRPVDGGVGPMALGAGALWVAATAAATLARLDLRTGALGPWMTLGAPANGLRFARGYVWASLGDIDSIARIGVRRKTKIESEAGHNPQQIAVAHGSVFVVSYADHRLVVLDPGTLRRTSSSVRLSFNPYAIAADERGMWVTGLGTDTVTRLAYR
jgi:streptogramin lyase